MCLLGKQGERLIGCVSWPLIGLFWAELIGVSVSEVLIGWFSLELSFAVCDPLWCESCVSVCM